MTARFQDMIHSIFRKIRSQRDAIARRYEELGKKRLERIGAEQNADQRARIEAEPVQIHPSEFPDVLDPFKKAFKSLLGPKELLDPEIQQQELQYRTEDGQSLPISALSSGEREVVNIVFDFILRNPSDCVIVFDEPELHLHPELSYRLIQTLRGIGSNNQFIFCTHSPEIITASLDSTVMFIAPPRDKDFNQAIAVREDDETHQALKLLGQSIGIISLGKKIVLIEGQRGSLDKQTYGAILKARFPKLVLVPSGGKAILQSFSALHDKVLAKTIWGVEFYMLCDRDALPLADASEIVSATAGRLRLLRNYHLENYFLDENVISKVFEAMTPPGSWQRSPSEIRARIRSIAAQHVSYAAALISAAFFRERVGNIDVMPKDCHAKQAAELATMIGTRAAQELSRVSGVLAPQGIADHVTTTQGRIEASLSKDTDDWKGFIPGRIILHRFCSEASINVEYFRTAYINAAAGTGANPFAEITEIFEDFDSYKPH